MSDEPVEDQAVVSSSRWSYKSKNSILSIYSEGSVLSIGSVGSFLSIGSIGSAKLALLDRLLGQYRVDPSAASKWSLLSWRANRGRMTSGSI
jgi:hypothetical protein